MKLVFFGSPVEAVVSLELLLQRGHDIVAVYSQPDKPAGRAASPVPTPVKAAATTRGIDVRTPLSLRDATTQAALKALGADAFVVVAYGKLLPAAVLTMPRLGVLNVHPSLLPKHRGPSPVQQAILDGASHTGVTVMLLDEGMDTGPVLAQSEPIEIGEDETCPELMVRLFARGAVLLADTLEQLGRGAVAPIPQDPSKATLTKLLSRENGEIDWSLPAVRTARMVRAYDPWPGTQTRWRGKALKVLEARVASARSTGAPGTVTVSEGRLLVATGEGALEVARLQLEGKRAVTAADFLRGHPDIAGRILGV